MWRGQFFTQDHTFLSGLNQNQESRHQKRLRDNPPGIHDLSAPPLLLVSSKWDDTQMIAAGQINPVRAGSWEDEMHSRFKAPPSSPQVISCHTVPRERDRADSRWELRKANTAERQTWPILMFCAQVQLGWLRSICRRADASADPTRSSRQKSTSWRELTPGNYSCGDLFSVMPYHSSENLAQALVKGSLLTACPNPSIHKCTQSHRKIELRWDRCVLVS